MKLRNEMNNMKASTSLDDIFAQIKKGETKTLNIIIKADVQGSVEAVKQSLENCPTTRSRFRSFTARSARSTNPT